MTTLLKTMIKKLCSKCNKEKEISLFQKIGTVCKSCKKEYDKKYNEENKNRIAKTKKQYQINNAEKIKAAKKDYYENNKKEILEKCKKYREINSEIIKERRKIYHNKHKERYSAYRKKNKERYKELKKNWDIKNKDKNKEYRLVNKEKLIQNKKNFHKNNPSARRMENHNRRQRLKGKLSEGIIEKLYKLQKGKCVCCKQPLRKDFHVDHIMPLALGGTNTDDNVQLLTSKCNLQKSAKHPFDFMQERGFLI